MRVIEPRRSGALSDLSKLWRYREMLGFLALRDIQVRYRQSVLGAAWAVIQPLGLMVVITLVRKLLGIGTGADPVLIFAGLLPWTFFSAGITASTNSLVNNAGMLRKVYFPRLVLPISALGAPLMDLLVALGVLGGLMAWFGIAWNLQLLLLPLLVLSAMVAALGFGVLLSALTVTYRDFRHVVPFLVQLLFFVTPVIYTAADVPEHHRWLLGLTPIGGVIEAFRAAILNQPLDWTAWASSLQFGLLSLLVGVCYFLRAERRFADVV